jgi:predicted nucleotidyltransferase component of viral defense system
MNRPLTEARITEFFHLAFLQVVQARVDQARYIVKGGASLRYFFGSARYSQVLDLDAVDFEPWDLEEKVDEVLASPAMGLLLRSCDLTLETVTKPEQTATRQRWKPCVAAAGRRQPVRTKIEFSHRGADPRRVLEAVPDHLVAPYALRAPSMQHYTAPAAVEQKVGALAHRSETQARDVFDLDLLLRHHREVIHGGQLAPALVEAALERLFELPFEAFKDQVVVFLDPEAVELYDDPGSWEQMRNYVAERLMELS